MKVLVLSCNTGGGHNSCARHIQSELNSNGITCDFENYYKIVNFTKKDHAGKLYSASVGKKGGVFKYIYKIGEAYNKMNIISPVYLVNKIHSKRLYKYIKNNKYDLVICPHLFPGMALSAINKKNKVNFLFIATDYECSPFTNEIKADYYIIPKDLEASFASKGIKKEKLVPLGIPISSSYLNINKGKKSNKNRKNLLILLGSMGNGSIENILKDLLDIKDIDITIVCGNNKKLYKRLQKYNSANLNVKGYCKNVNYLINTSDIVISKPGGLSSTEIAAFRKGLIHVYPIAKQECKNIEYFTKRGLSLEANNEKEVLSSLKQLLNDTNLYNKMIKNQEKYISDSSAKDLVNFIKEKYLM